MTHNNHKIGINRSGAMFQMTMNMIFSNMPAIELFIKERPIFM